MKPNPQIAQIPQIEFPEHIAERQARVARMNRPVTLWPSPLTDRRHQELYEAACAGRLPEPDWKSAGLADWRAERQQWARARVIAGVLLGAAVFLALLYATAVILDEVLP